jgi:hypothetical protein
MTSISPEQNAPLHSLSSRSNSIELSIAEMAMLMRSNIEVKDRTYHLKNYEKCFVGFEAVQYLIENNFASSVDEAIVLGNVMLEQGLFFHVARDHSFKNERLFYRFTIDDRSHGQSAKDGTGKNISMWRRFASGYLGESDDVPDRMSLVSNIPSRDDEHGTLDLSLMSEIPPMDEWNVKLLDNVHPSTWRPPDEVDFYNLLVIGGGAAGLVSSIGASGWGFISHHLMS